MLILECRPLLTDKFDIFSFGAIAQNLADSGEDAVDSLGGWKPTENDSALDSKVYSNSLRSLVQKCMSRGAHNRPNGLELAQQLLPIKATAMREDVTTSGWHIAPEVLFGLPQEIKRRKSSGILEQCQKDTFPNSQEPQTSSNTDGGPTIEDNRQRQRNTKLRELVKKVMASKLASIS